MDLLAVLGLVGLALVDSTSMGTLVLPLMLLLAPRVHVGRYLVFLGTVAAFYAMVGTALVAAAGPLLTFAGRLADLIWLRWAELVVGGLLVAIGLVGDRLVWRRPGTSPPRAARWRAAIQGSDAKYSTVAGVGLAAALVEVASMLPFLAAIGIITAADLPVVGCVSVVIAYSLVMVLPALLLLGVRQALDGPVRGPLTTLSAWLDRHTGGAVLWVLAIVGVLLVGDAAPVLLD